MLRGSYSTRIIPRVSSVPCRTCLLRCASRVSWRGALIGPTSDDLHYAKRLDLKQSASMLTEEGFLWSAAVADAAKLGQRPETYLAHVDDTVQHVIRRNVLHDREASTADIREVLSGEGELGLVLGGKSVGKSFLLRTLAKQQNDECDAQSFSETMSMRGGLLQERPVVTRIPRRVIVYDARDGGSDLSDGLVSVLKGDPSFFSRFKAAFRTVCECGTAVAVGAAVSTGSTPLAAHGTKLEATAGMVAGDVFDAFFNDRPLPLNQVLAAFILCCKETHCFPCLVIDEANAALTAESTAAREHTLAALRLLTEHSKQLRQMNVILAASEHSEPFRLNALGFKSDHWTFTLVVGELPPKAMREMLMGEWGLGQNLADAVMSVWGGHVWAAAKGLKWLKLKKDDFEAIDNPVAFSLDAIRGAVYCTQAESSCKLEGMLGMNDMLRSVAELGYAPYLDEEDPRVVLGSQRNVWGVVGRSTFAPSVPPEAWKKYPRRKTVVVAASQAMRLLLASELAE